MTKLKDLTGKKFGRLSVLERGLNKRNKPAWKCLCDCGNIVEIAGCELKQNQTKSCGCLRKDLLKKDIAGNKYGKLTAIKPLRINTSTIWLCECECGNFHECTINHLEMNQVKSCGCWFKKTEEVMLDEAKIRFHDSIEKTDYCWIWKGNFIRNYGCMFYKKIIRSHRFSYMIYKGEIEKGKLICHTCDNPSCVNPDHLYQGTSQDNYDDMKNRGRFKPRGKTQTLSCCI